MLQVFHLVVVGDVVVASGVGETDASRRLEVKHVGDPIVGRLERKKKKKKTPHRFPCTYLFQAQSL